MKSVSVIVCNSGRGHLKRALWILRRLMGPGHEPVAVDLFVDADKLTSFQTAVSEISRPGSSIAFYDIKSDVLEYEETFMSRYADFLKRADLVWCDNLVFPVKYHDCVFLTGQFLWSDIIENEAFRNDELKVLEERKPPMFGIKYFATPSVREKTAFSGVGIYDYYPVNCDGQQRGILLSCGATDEANHYFEEAIDKLIDTVASASEDIEFFIEPAYFDRFPRQKNIVKAAFTEEMFGKIKAAVIRPGVGTLCDVLTKGARIFPFFEEGNFEVRHNTNALQGLGVGEEGRSVPDALRGAIAFLEDAGARERHLNNIRRLDFGGLDQIVERINKVIQGEYIHG